MKFTNIYPQRTIFGLDSESDIPNCDLFTLFFALFVADWFLGAP